MNKVIFVQNAKRVFIYTITLAYKTVQTNIMRLIGHANNVI